MTDATGILPHATGAVDPLPPGRIAMWLVIAADLMFFVGLVGAFLVLRAGNAELFADHARGLAQRVAGAEIVTLVLGSGLMFIAGRMSRAGSYKTSGVTLAATMLLGIAFAGERTIEYLDNLNHHTMIARLDPNGPLMVLDGDIDWWNRLAPGETVVDGYAAPLPGDFDIHAASELDVARMSSHGEGKPKEFEFFGERIRDVSYGPGKNIFYAIWYTLTGVHLVHVGVGLVAIGGLLVQWARGKAMARHLEYVGLFWHHVVLIGVVVFFLF